MTGGWIHGGLMLANVNGGGGEFSNEEIQQVWMKAIPIVGKDPSVYRHDKCGALIECEEYGRQSLTGWEIDHRRPLSQEGPDTQLNLQPLHWANNREKGDRWPKWVCAAGRVGEVHQE